MAADAVKPAKMTVASVVLAATLAVASLSGTMSLVTQAIADRAVSAQSVTALTSISPAEGGERGSLSMARSALWRDPLNQDALNIAYVDLVRDRGSATQIAQVRKILAELGWRSTSTQQNLILAAAMRQDVPEVMDRVDALLRRNKFGPLLDPFISAVEADPQTRKSFVGKLRTNPPWREMLLLRGGELRGEDRLAGRMATMNELVERGDRPSRVEVAPFLAAAMAGGQREPAFRLWSRTLRQPTDGGLLYDGRFKIAAEQGVRPALPVPFEWKFENGDGYTTNVGSDGVAIIRWSGRGVPLLLQQPIRVPPAARGYRLVIDADRSSVPLVAEKLSIALSCDARGVEFRPVGRTAAAVTLVANAPVGCPIPIFSISGRLQDVATPITVTMARVRLEAAPFQAVPRR